MIQDLRRISNIEKSEDLVLLFPEDLHLEMTNDNLIETKGLGNLDKKKKDLIHIISIGDALKVDFEYLNILSPRTFAESLNPIAPHCTVQGIITLKITKKTIPILKKLEKECQYDKHEFDRFWVGEKKIEELKIGEYLLVMNRRIGGWDGSMKRPVIELLGAGGHIPTIIENNIFHTLSPIEAIQKEVFEELGFNLNSDSIQQLGGFHNLVSNELVILFSINILDFQLESIQQKAIKNYEENIAGIYVGEIRDVIHTYLDNPKPFAGGEIAKPTNFPSNSELMSRVYKILT